MNLRRRQQRVLIAIESDLSDSDPDMYALFSSFARRAGGHDLRWVEEIEGERFWFRWRRKRGRPER